MYSKLEYLSKYNKKIEIIRFDEVEKHIHNIPVKWHDILRENDFYTKKKRVLELWKSTLNNELRNTIQYLAINLESLDLLYDGLTYSLLYGIKSNNNIILYYEGQFVLDLNKKVELKNNWNSIPKSIRKFYEDLHNGFYYYASHSMGLVPEDEVTHLAEYDWDIIERLDEPIKININSSFGFFSTGMGAYVVVDSNNCFNETSTLWFKNKQPKYGLNFWDIVDEWIVIGFQS